ncbi:flagellar basal body P-ring formation chaperone FlgA [Acinetobacter dispersus]|uniref:Flagella basal body P-ring formation protein FlgA n=1 Tax=Acinetobacter dispersus TaxID=70348 RepID=N9MEF8_9GAMM|nr:flagellar basal body P-ring formation chaperone FlgA [Acinetobacter dispersus]ENW91560.1 flagella basal body P-ring formation protein FlgA [Acinetobacter dispersus]
MRLIVLMLCIVPLVQIQVNACEGFTHQQFVDMANNLVQEQLEKESTSRLFPLFAASDHRYSKLKLVSSIYQPRVGFEVSDCDPLTMGNKIKVMWFRPEIKKMAWVFKQNASRNQPLDSVLVEYQEIDVIKERVNNTALAAGPFNENFWLTQSVKLNEPVLKRHLKETPWVYKDQQVRVLVVSDGIAIETTGVAQQFGQYLDKVNVRLLSNNQLVRTTVIKKGTVRID